MAKPQISGTPSGDPHRPLILIDLFWTSGNPCSISGFRYVPRQGTSEVGGRIKEYRIYVGDNLVRRKG